VPRLRIPGLELLAGIGGSIAVLAVILARPPGWDALATVGATLLPAGLVLYGAAAARRARETQAQRVVVDEQRSALAREAAETDLSRAELQRRLGELIALNELAGALSSTLDLDELIGRALDAVVHRLPFDRALILLVDPTTHTLTDGRAIGGTAEVNTLVGQVHLALSDERATLVQLARAEGPMVFRDIDEDPYEPNRMFARALEVTSFLGTPLITNGRTVGILAVDNRLTGRDLERSMGPLLFTVGTLLAAAIENARLYAEIEAQNRDLEARVTQRTAQLADATEAAIAARATAEAASASKSTFLASVSHELRTPLTSVVGFTKLVRKRFADVVQPALAGLPDGGVAADPRLERAVRQIDENLAIMATEGERLTAMINDVLDLQKIEAGRMEFRREPVDLVAVVDQSAAAVSALFETSGLRLVRQAPEAPLPAVTGDHHRLVQVVINLLSNAVKFTAAGSVTVAVRSHEDEIVVAVTDTGTGIAEADRQRVFEAFAQAGDSLTDKPRGTGLGLPISREIVEEHGGRMWLESELGAGSTFAFALPVAPAVEAPVAAPVAAEGSARMAASWASSEPSASSAPSDSTSPSDSSASASPSDSSASPASTSTSASTTSSASSAS
jgi:signal transduction histidine kinase